MDNSDLKFSSRRHIIDKERAIGTAKNPKDSHYGRTLLRNNVFEGRLLSSEMGKLGNEARRNQMHLDQQKKLFLKKNLSLPDPMILVERPPSPDVLKKASFPEEFTDDEYYFNKSAPPHYAKPRSLDIKAPSTHVIMDMFKVTKKKKVNIWEEVMIEKEQPHFESAVRPARKLSELETQEIEKAWNAHRRQIESIKIPPPPRTRTESALCIKPMEEFYTRSAPPSQYRQRSAKLKDGVKVRSVTFITELHDVDDDSSTVESEETSDKTKALKAMSHMQNKGMNKYGLNGKKSMRIKSVSLSAIDSQKISTAAEMEPKLTAENSKIQADDNQEKDIRNSKTVKSPLARRKPKVIEATRKQKRRPNRVAKESSNTDTMYSCKITAPADSENTMHPSKTSHPRSGRRKKKKAFLSLLVDEG